MANVRRKVTLILEKIFSIVAFARLGVGKDNQNVRVGEPGYVVGAPTFVHVGKCAGGTVERTLHDTNVIANSYQNIQIFEEDILDRLVVITVRDPLERTISAFNWRDPKLVQHQRMRKEESEFYDCFSTVNEFAHALKGTERCSVIARQAIAGFTNVTDCTGNQQHHFKYGHISTGFEFHFMCVAHLFREKIRGVDRFRCVLIHTETIKNDLKAAIHALGGTLSRKSNFFPNRRVHEGYKGGPKRTYLDPEGKALLQMHLAKEYEVILLLERACAA